MRILMITAAFLLAMPITGFGWFEDVLKEGIMSAEGSNLLLDPHLVCKKTRRLRGKHNDICKNETSLMKEITKGINLGFKECEYQFKNRRWNCTSHKKNIMRKVLIRDTRETSFVNAITAAGLTYAVTRACTMGNLVECSCDKNQRRQQHNNVNSNDIIIDDMNNMKNMKKRNKKIGKNIALPDGDWEWGGCGDNVHFGLRKSKEFLDSIRYKRRSDIKTLVKLHNNNAGRLAVKLYMRLECKCHGLSGSCTIRTCWMKMASFREIGNRLKDRFDGAVKVISRNDGNSFMPEGLTIKPPTRQDLVYTEDSPDFCRSNHKTGSLGTYGRECNATSQGVDGCELLCCGRGYDHRIVQEKVNCKCVFKWCCDVTCSVCIENRDVNTCR